MKPILITIEGDPVPKGRGRAFVRKNGKIGVITPKATRAWEEAARWQAKIAMKDRAMLEGCLTLWLTIHCKVPASWPEWKKAGALIGFIRPTGKPDLDNYVKGLDFLNGIVFEDDSQIIEIGAEKVYSDHPRVFIIIGECLASSSKIVRRGDMAEHL